jgi:hypothetical protein
MGMIGNKNPSFISILNNLTIFFICIQERMQNFDQGAIIGL